MQVLWESEILKITVFLRFRCDADLIERVHGLFRCDLLDRIADPYSQQIHFIQTKLFFLPKAGILLRCPDQFLRADSIQQVVSYGLVHLIVFHDDVFQQRRLYLG